MKVKRSLFILTFILSLSFSGTAQSTTLQAPPTQMKIMRFYPNPATSFINFNFQRSLNNTNYTLQIYNFMGKKVYDFKSLSENTRVELNDFYRGIYIFQLRDQNGIVVDSGKFQVIK